MLLDSIYVIVGSVLAAFASSTVTVAWMKRRWVKQDESEVLQEANHGKEIDADINAFDSIYKRLELVEGRLDKVTIELTEQKVENAKLESENARLSKENDRQEKDIQRLRDRLHDMTNEIATRDLQILELKESLKRREVDIGMLRTELHHTTSELNTVKLKVLELDDVHISQQ